MITIDGFQIDAMISISPTSVAQVTQHPVEEGSDISDHIILNPQTVVIEGVVTDTPLEAVTRTVGTKPSSDAYALLTEIQTSRRLVEIKSNVFPPFKDMALTSLSAPKNQRTGDSLRFTATFQKLNIATVAAEDKETLVTLPRAKKKKRKGAKPAKVETPKVPEAAKAEERSRSIGHWLLFD
jgi:hypothetical protein